MRWLQREEDWTPACDITQGDVLLATCGTRMAGPLWVRQYVARIVAMPQGLVCFIDGNDNLWILPEGSMVTRFSVPSHDQCLLEEDTSHADVEMPADMRSFLTGLATRAAVVQASFHNTTNNNSSQHGLSTWLVQATSTGTQHIAITIDQNLTGALNLAGAVGWTGGHHHTDNHHWLDLSAATHRRDRPDADQLAEIVLEAPLGGGSRRTRNPLIGSPIELRSRSATLPITN